MSQDILIVDDETDIRELIAGILNDEGHNTRTAADGLKALELIKTRQPNLVVLDVWLGDSERDGLKILDIIKRDHPFVPVIMISGHGTIETAVSAMKKGAYDFLEKPFQTDHLLLIVERALNVKTKNLKSKPERCQALLVTHQPFTIFAKPSAKLHPPMDGFLLQDLSVLIKNQLRVRFTPYLKGPKHLL